MLNENLKNLRKSKGITQEEMAERLNVVRQTISKWEKGTSVPDAEMLSRIAELFEVSVSTLLGETIETTEEHSILAEQLARINEQLAMKNRRIKRIFRILIAVIAAIAILIISVIIFSSVYPDNVKTTITTITESTEIIEP